MTQRSPGSRPVTKDEFDRLEAKVDEMVVSQKALLDAWTTATGVVKFVKLLSTVIAGIAAIWMIFTHGVAPKG